MEGEWFDFGVEEPDILTELTVQRLRPNEFPPDIRLDEDFVAEGALRRVAAAVDFRADRFDDRPRRRGFRFLCRLRQA